MSSGFIRLTNEDITDLYKRVKIGTRVVVLSSTPAMTAGKPAVDFPAEVFAATPSGAPDMPRKRHKSEDMTAKRQQVDVLVAQGQNIAHAARQVGISESRYYRWRQERGAPKRDEVNKPEHETPKGLAQLAASAPRSDNRQVEFKAETAVFEE